ncbi:beta-N-acetylhexosaminidase [Paenibacillus abyssi]|uniref:Beta-N-acetylhexosaminidase n=2 Tax=Paenibacillus abyssi TaxID=1340531 RepID=A0A917G0X3_9BACL|nr:beta-N-acetylhexosaminidase [Paenibacillus abyssi]
MMKKPKHMTLEEKVGQLFTFYYKDAAYSEAAEQFISEFKAGGIFLDMESLDTPEQVHGLTGRMQRASLERGSGIPLFIAADFVAGAGCKLPRGGAVYFPKNMAIGAADDESLAYESGRVTAAESLAMGVNFNYSPVVDINNNPDNPVIGTHSFGDSLDVVSRMGAAVIRGYQEHGMIATAKHFPGHGDTNVDSHLDLPVLSFDRQRLERFELAPFRKAIEAGVDAVMVGHIAVPALDEELLPASLSRPMVTGLLREQMGFEGLIVTDGMSMKGVTSKFTQARACVMALHAGADILLVDPLEPGEAQAMVNAVLEAVRSGELDEAQITRSVERVILAKEKYGLTPEQYDLRAFDGSGLELAASKRISLELARKALRPHGDAALWDAVRKGAAEGARLRLICEDVLAVFAKGLVSNGAVSERMAIASYEQLPDALLQVPKQEALIVGITCNKRMRQDVLEQLNHFALERDQPVVLVHFGSPFDAVSFPNVPALLLHDRAPALQEAAVEYLVRQLQSEGSL